MRRREDQTFPHANCLAGPAAAMIEDCEPADLDRDEDADLLDARAWTVRQTSR